MLRALAVCCIAALAGCGDAARACRVAADCASGQCRSDGTCAPAASTGSSSSGSSSASTGGSSGSTSSGPSSSSSGSSSTSGSTGSGTCLPDGDDTITRAESPLGAGLHATFRIAQNATWDTSGTQLGDGGTAWDLSVALSGDQNVRVDTTSLSGAWFANDFAGATYTSQLSQAQDLLGVFEVTADALLLRGVVSPVSGLYQTELTYSPPVKVLAFPLSSSATWSTSSTVTGQAQGAYVTYSEAYQSSVDKRGMLITPYSTFPVLRVATDLTRTAGALVTTTRTFTFATDCFGAVAVVTSQTDGAQGEFTNVAEARRLAP